MIIGTVRLFTGFSVKTELNFKILWMKFLFLPSMAILAFILQSATILIRCNEIFSVPILAHILWVIKDWRLSSVILPVVGVNAYIPLMVILSIRTPNSFEVENVKVHIRLKLFYQLNWKFWLCMSKRAELSILTFNLPIQIRGAELSLVFVRMVKFLHSVVRFVTIISKLAFFVVLNIPALFWLIKS